MDNRDTEVQSCSHSQCVHGMCLDHEPEWENIGENSNKPNHGIFGKSTYWTERCCGRFMARYKVVQTQQCKKCGRIEDKVILDALALCLCCGHHFDNSPEDYGGDCF